jgi:sulfite exporter TauE/SafE
LNLELLLASAASIGLLQGFLHCSGMCGPFVLAYSMAMVPKSTDGTAVAPPSVWKVLLRNHLPHNLGRVTAFTVLGVVFGAIGSFLNIIGATTGIEAIAGFIGGGLMIWWAVDEFRTGHGGAFVEKWSLLQWKPVQRYLRQGIHKSSATSAYLSGTILGLHPCGLLFAMLLSASSTGSALRGGLTLLAFGIGTIPALFSVAIVGFYGRKRLQSRTFAYIAAVFIGLSGVLFILRGLAVNHWIPSVSPWLF